MCIYYLVLYCIADRGDTELELIGKFNGNSVLRMLSPSEAARNNNNNNNDNTNNNSNNKPTNNTNSSYIDRYRDTQIQRYRYINAAFLRNPPRGKQNVIRLFVSLNIKQQETHFQNMIPHRSN